MPNEFEYFTNKRPDRVYISKSIQPRPSPSEPEPDRTFRILSKVFDTEESHQFVTINNEVVLRITNGGRQEVKITFYDDNREIKTIAIQKFTSKDGTPHRYSFTFRGEEIEKLYNLLHMIKHIELEGAEKVRLEENTINQWSLTDAEKHNFFVENLDMAADVIRDYVTKSDVIALAYRKQQIETFYHLLYDDVFFQEKQKEWGKRGKEAVWQQFFEENPWIFGYGLSYIFTSRLDDRKLEQVTTGYSVSGAGKRVDALMQTRGLVSSLCFVEIKTHCTTLLQHEKAYRSESWRISDELAGSIAQIQKTINKALKTIQTKLELESDDGTPTGDIIFLYQPKSFVVIGCLQEFTHKNGVNEQQYSSFELFRRNISNPEIITFDELYERARFIVEHSQNEHPFK